MKFLRLFYVMVIKSLRNRPGRVGAYPAPGGGSSGEIGKGNLGQVGAFPDLEVYAIVKAVGKWWK